MRGRERNLLNLGLLAGIALLLFGIVSLWWEGGSVTPGPPSAKAPEVPPAPILKGQEPLSAFEVVAARNLFSPGRKGLAQGQAAGQNSLDGCHLMGTIVIGDTRAALIGGKGKGPDKGEEVEILYQGDKWGEFTVVEITPTAVVLASKNGRHILSFPE